MEVYLIRHGQSYNNAVEEYEDKRVQDPELTEVGHKQAALVAQFLKNAENLEDIVALPLDAPERSTGGKNHRITHLYASPMHRALQTARPIAAALGMQPQVWIDIHEVGGIWLRKDGITQGFGGRTRAQVIEEFPDYLLPDAITELGWWNPDAGEEDLMGCYGRAMRVARLLRQRARDEATRADVLAIVTHGTFMDALVKAMTERLPTEGFFHWHYNTAITRFDLLADGKLIIRYINRVPHLTPDLIT
jgi:broad specificity phosphatase PhoE